MQRNRKYSVADIRQINFVMYSLLMIFVLLAAKIEAQEIYKRVDATGRVHYSTKASDNNAQPIVLPELSKPQEGEHVKLLKTCDDHGGIDCQAGADQDGSVICANGFRDASARFNFSCSTARLRIADIDSKPLKVTLRNLRPVVAVQPVVKLTLNGTKREFSGPDTIDAYGVGEFLLNIDDSQQISSVAVKQNLTVSCRNCD